MKTLTFTLGIFLLSFLFLPETIVQAQSVLNPNDPVVTYNGTMPAQPPFGQIGKWIRTVRMAYPTDDYKAYIYKGVAFRLKFPKRYAPGVVDNLKYPMLVYFHGLGEAAPITDNEFHLLWGWDYFKAKVDYEEFNGYVLYMQTQGFWSIGHHTYLTEIINYMIANNKLDQFRVTSAGLSSGAYSAIEMGINFPTYVNAVVPTSGCSIGYRLPNVTEALKYTPVWTFQGGLDGSPAPSTATQVRDAFLAAGANYKLTIYPDLAHNTWNRAWTEQDYIPFINRAHQANPWALFGKTVFCEGENINVKIGLTAGFAQYEWRKDNVLIPGATSNFIQVTQTGSYSARIRRGSEWSVWSPTPVVIVRSGAASAPAIQVAGLMSKVLPALDGKTSVTLQVPTGYNSYEWYRAGSTTLLSTTNTIIATYPDDYRVRAVTANTCPAPFSPLFRVVNANGPNKPPAASNLTVTTLTNSSLRLNWTNAAAPAYNETGFEIYQATAAAGPYTLIAITGADVQTHTVNNLQAGNTIYYFKLRAVNETGAAAASNVANNVLQGGTDTQAPSVPGNLRITGNAGNAVGLQWNPSTDNVGVLNYEIFVNGQKSYVTAQTTFIVYNLVPGGLYAFTVKAKDAVNNLSGASNQVSTGSVASPANSPYNIYVNLNRTLPAGYPWNNTNAAPVNGNVYRNLKSDQDIPTTVNLNVASPFFGENALGVNTGNNSAVVEDNVLRTVWIVERNNPGKLRVDGLNMNMDYHLIFFASQDGFGSSPDKTTVYTVGTTSVSVNAVNNRTHYEIIYSVKPDLNGGIDITIGAGGTSQYGYLGVLAIQGVPSPGSALQFSESARTTLSENLPDVSVNAYPNPFVSEVKLKLSLNRVSDKIDILVTDVTGKTIFTKELRQVPGGTSTHTLDMNSKSMRPGVYFMKITGLPGGKSKTIRLVK